jgi:NADPH-dependent 7-cyano-7-deazaguanine reductase QueF
MNTCCGHKYTIIASELTFFGFPEQSDSSTITIEIHPNVSSVDLKSVQQYLLQFRNKQCSYESLLNAIFDDFKDFYDPVSLRVKIEIHPRDNIISVLEKEWAMNEIE